MPAATQSSTPNHDKNKIARKVRLPAPATPAATSTSTSASASALVQRTLLAPDTLTARDMTQLQRTVGNRTTGQLLAQANAPSAQRKPRLTERTALKPSAAPQRPTVQRSFDFLGLKGTPKETELERALTALSAGSPEWGGLEKDRDIHIIFALEEGSDPNPAGVSEPMEDKARNRKVFVLKFQRWFLEKNSIGTSIGVLNHEIGVHVLPYCKKIKENLAAVAKGEAPPHKDEDLSAKEPNGIDDHRQVMEKGTAEFETYITLALNSAGALDKAGQKQAAQDALFAYMMDVAAMAPSGDKGVIAKRVMLPLSASKREQTLEYVLARYQVIAAEVAKRLGSDADIPKMTTESLLNEFLTYRSRIPHMNAVTSAAVEHPKTTVVMSLLFLCLVIYLIIKLLRG